MKLPKIALYYKSLENIGGIERVVLGLGRIFTHHSDKVIIITEEPIVYLKNSLINESYSLDKKGNRSNQITKIIKDNKIDWIIYNDPSLKNLEKEIKQIHEIGCKTALIIHFSFSSPIYFSEASNMYKTVSNIGTKFDAVACVSIYDKIFWQTLGIKSFHVQNPFVKKEITNLPSHKENIIIWIGRAADQKKPYSALKILSLVVKEKSNVKLLMVGVGKAGKQLKKYAKNLKIEKNLEIIEQTNDVEKYYSQSKLHLLTSITESFCLVIAEAKQYGIPTIMYDIPFLDLTNNKEGIIVHDYNDNLAMAKSIIKLLDDDEFYSKQSYLAKESLNNFNDENVALSWYNLFNNIIFEKETKEGIIVRELIKAWNIHSDQQNWKINICDIFNKLLPLSLENLSLKILSLFEKILTLKGKIL